MRIAKQHNLPEVFPSSKSTLSLSKHDSGSVLTVGHIRPPNCRVQGCKPCTTTTKPTLNNGLRPRNFPKLFRSSVFLLPVWIPRRTFIEPLAAVLRTPTSSIKPFPSDGVINCLPLQRELFYWLTVVLYPLKALCECPSVGTIAFSASNGSKCSLPQPSGLPGLQCILGKDSYWLESKY